MALLCDFSQIRCRIDVPLRAVRINLPDTEVQVLPGRPCPRVTGTAELLACLYRIACLYGNFAEVHVGTLYLAAVRTGVFHGQRFVTGCMAFVFDSDDLAVFFRGQDRIAVAPDVDTRVHTFLAVCRILPHTEWRGDEKKLFPLHRKRIVHCISDLTERVLFHAEPLSLRLHFLHDLPVVLLQPVLFDDTLQAVGIMPARGIARLFEALCPALVVIGRERETAGIAAVLFQEA